MNGERDMKYEVGKGLRSEAARASELRIFAQETQSFSHICALWCANMHTVSCIYVNRRNYSARNYNVIVLPFS